MTTLRLIGWCVAVCLGVMLWGCATTPPIPKELVYYPGEERWELVTKPAEGEDPVYPESFPVVSMVDGTRHEGVWTGTWSARSKWNRSARQVPWSIKWEYGKWKIEKERRSDFTAFKQYRPDGLPHVLSGIARMAGNQPSGTSPYYFIAIESRIMRTD